MIHGKPGLNTAQIVHELDTRISQLERAKSLLGEAVTKPAKKRRTLSAKGRANIIAAQRARWAKVKRTSRR